MPKVVIEIEDMPDGKVKTTLKPNFETIMSKWDSHGDISPAEGFALTAANAIRAAAKSQESSNIIRVPIIGR